MGKTGRRKRRRNLSLYYLMVFVIVVITAAVLSVTVLFKAENITVNGDSPYTAEQIISASALETGDNMIRMNLTRAEERIKNNLVYIENVSIRRLLPDTIEITVERCVPYANIACSDGWLLVSGGGRILERNSTADESLPKFRGYDSVITFIGGYIESDDPEKNELITEIADAVSNTSLDGVREIDISDRYNISINYEDRITIELGTSADIEYKIGFAKTLIDTKIGSTQEGTITVYNNGSAGFREKDDIEKFNSEYHGGTANPPSTGSSDTSAGAETTENTPFE